MNSKHRRARLKDFLEKRYKDDRQAFLQKAKIAKERLTQLLDDKETFGERAARAMEARLSHPDMYFDVTDDAQPGHPNDGRLLVPTTLREEKLLAYFKALTPELWDEINDATRERRLREAGHREGQGAPVKNHIGNVAMEVAYGFPSSGQKEHPT